MTTITTVRGDIAPDQLGYTSIHEHLNTDLALMAALMERYGAPKLPASMTELRIDNLAFLREVGPASEECWTRDDVEFSVAELNYFQEVGGSAVCDASPIGLRGDVRVLHEASLRSGMHIVFATGLYVRDARPERYQGMSESEQESIFLAEVNDGVEGTGLRPGLLKCAMSATSPDAALYEEETATLRALARISSATGLSVHVHTAFPMSPNQVLAAVEVALREGMDPARLVMIHMDSFLRPWDALERYISDSAAVRTVDTTLARRVLATGANIGFDSWSSPVAILPDDHDRLKGLVELLRDGFGDRIVLGHDTATKPVGKTYGYYGFTRFPQFIPPALSQLGFADDVFRKLVIDNPARILAH